MANLFLLIEIVKAAHTPCLCKNVTVDGKKKKLAVKKGAEGRVYEGVTKKDMREITLEKNRGGVIDYRKGGMVLSTTDNRKKK